MQLTAVTKQIGFYEKGSKEVLSSIFCTFTDSAEDNSTPLGNEIGATSNLKRVLLFDSKH